MRSYEASGFSKYKRISNYLSTTSIILSATSVVDAISYILLYIIVRFEIRVGSSVV
jgi:preprotein translocase subunit SecF